MGRDEDSVTLLTGGAHGEQEFDNVQTLSIAQSVAKSTTGLVGGGLVGGVAMVLAGPWRDRRWR